jgi:hypothetical protein
MWITFGLVLVGLGIDSLRGVVVRRPSTSEIAEVISGSSTRKLPPNLESMVRSRWLLQESSLAQLLAIVFVIGGILAIAGGVLLLI